MAANSSTIASSMTFHDAERLVFGQNLHLIWLDSHLDESDKHFRSNFDRLRSMAKKIDTFTNTQKCIDFVTKTTDDGISMIVSESSGEKIISLFHDLQQIETIYVFGTDTISNTKWIDNYSKIKGVFMDIDSLCGALQRAKRQSNDDSVQISLVSTSGESDIVRLDQLEPSFMYTQLLKEILLEINDDSDEKPREELASYCRHLYVDNAFELKNIDQFVREYHDHSPVWWYTYECFLYPMLNRSLRLFDIHVILKMRFFLRHLSDHLQQLHMEQFADNQIPFTVYRGQGLTKTYLEKLRRTKGGLLAFNNFLSTSKEKRVSMNFARCALGNPDFVGILYTMNIDPAVSSTPFASLTNVSYYADTEQEILFAMNTVFRIDEIKAIDKDDRLWEVQLTLTADNDPRLRDLLARLRQDTQGASGWHRLGHLLIRLGQSKQAENVYQFLLEQTSDEPIKGYFYHQLGCVKYQQGENTQAIATYQNALDIFLEVLPSDHSHIATCYNSMGAAHFSNGDYSKALSFYEQALTIREKTLPANHPSLTVLYTNMAIGYMKEQKYSQALSFYNKSLEIEQNNLPSNHPDLATTYNNIGGVYENLNDYCQSLSFHQKALDIREISLPANHPDIGESYHNIGSVYCSMGNYPKALSAHQKALAIRETHFSTNHPDLALTYSGMGILYLKMADFPKALAFFEKALKIRQQVLPGNHPDLAMAYNNMGVIYESMKTFPTAQSYFEDAVNIAKSIDHPHLSLFQNSLDVIKKKRSSSSTDSSY